MTSFRGWAVLAVLGLTLIAACTRAGSQSGATVPRSRTTSLEIDIKQPGSKFEPGAVGLSVDANELGTGHLSAHHVSLVRLMRLLGPSLLRVGGGSVDVSWWTSTDEAPPAWATNTITPADLSSLNQLLAITGWRVLLGIDLGHFEPTRAANEARVAQQILGAKLVGVEIGNEPNSYSAKSRTTILRPPTYNVSDYLHEVEAYRQALDLTAPGIAIYGPAVSRPRWLIQLGAAASIFTGITEHYYPTSTCQAGGLPRPTVTELLSPATRQQENETLNTLTHIRALTTRAIRIGETGTGACHGNSSASPVFASALWSLDWALRAASSGVQGLNFHGHLSACGPYTQSPICAPTVADANAGDFAPQPEYYGLLAASRLEGGRFVPTTLTAPRPLSNLTTWATVAPNGTIKLAIDNLAVGGSDQLISIEMSGYTAVDESLTSPSAEARSNIALGAASVSKSQRWRPKPERLTEQGGTIRVVVRPASAAIVTLYRSPK